MSPDKGINIKPLLIKMNRNSLQTERKGK